MSPMISHRMALMSTQKTMLLFGNSRVSMFSFSQGHDVCLIGSCSCCVTKVDRGQVCNLIVWLCNDFKIARWKPLATKHNYLKAWPKGNKLFKGEGHSRNHIFFVLTSKKTTLSWVTDRSLSFHSAYDPIEIPLQRSKKFIIGRRHFG